MHKMLLYGYVELFAFTSIFFQHGRDLVKEQKYLFFTHLIVNVCFIYKYLIAMS